MKTYLLDILNKYNRFSENLDVKTILCNKSWLVFNDTGNKELYIFQENGNLIASVNGNVHNGNWQYISANKSIIISFKEQSYMLHPSFFDKTIFALQQDGTSKYAFMIDEKQSHNFQPKSLRELNSYFENIERKKIEAEEQEKRRLVEQQRQQEQQRLEQLRIEQERKRQEEIRRQQEQRRLEEEQRRIQKEQQIIKQSKLFIISRILGCILLIIVLLWITLFAYNHSTDGAWIVALILSYVFLYLSYKALISMLRKKILVNYWKAEEKKKAKEAKKKWLKEEAFNIEYSLNNSQALELAKLISLSIEYAQQQLKKDILEFKVSWLCPNKTYKEIALIINDGKNTLLYEHLSIMGSQTVKLTKAMPQIRITLRLIWFDIPVYKIILIDKNENI